MNKIVIIIVVVVLLIAAAGGLYFFVLRDESEKPELRVEYSPGDFFTTNVSGSSRLLKSTIVLVVNSDKLDLMLEENNARIRDTIIFILRDLTEVEINDQSTWQRELRDRIVFELNERLGIDNFVDVLFNDYVMA